MGGSTMKRSLCSSRMTFSPPLTVKRPNDPRSLVREQAPGTSWRHPRCEVGQCVRARSPGLLFKFAAPCASVSFFCPRISKDVPNRLQDLQRSGVAISFWVHVLPYPKALTTLCITYWRVAGRSGRLPFKACSLTFFEFRIQPRDGNREFFVYMETQGRLDCDVQLSGPVIH